MFGFQDDFQKKYQTSKTLGVGSFATVKLCSPKSDKSKQFAVKIINLSSLKTEDLEALEDEIKICQACDHPNIVRLEEVFKCKKYVYLVMELMKGGEMLDRIVEKEFYDEATAKKEILQIIDALKYCHKRSIVHRDLKPENLLYDGGEKDAVVKLADFGLAKICNEDQLMKTACGTPGYVAPEILLRQKYDEKVDVWSLGVITYILLCGFPPFYHNNNAILFKKIKRGDFDFPAPYWTNVSGAAKDFITKILVVKPDDRASLDDLLNHRWLTSDANSNLAGNLPKLRQYNGMRKFKQAVFGIQAARFLREIQNPSQSNIDPSETKPKSEEKEEIGSEEDTKVDEA